MIRVEVTYAGADAIVVEDAVLTPLEAALNNVAHLAGLRGVARSGGATVDVRFIRGVGREEALAAVRAALAPVLTSLPADADVPTVMSGRPTSWVYATAPVATAAEARRAALAIHGVGLVETCGALEPTIAIELWPADLAAHAVTAREVLVALEGMNVALPAGRIDATGTQLSWISEGAVTSVTELDAVKIGPRGVPLEDLAAVRLATDHACTVAGTVGAALLRAGLRGPDDARAQARRAIEERWRSVGATVLAGPMTVGVAETGDPDGMLATWGSSVDDGIALTSTTAGRVVLLWPGHDPTTSATARAVQSAAELTELGPIRWAVSAAPLVEATVRGPDTAALLGQARAAVVALRDLPAIAGAGCQPCRLGTAFDVELDRDRMARLGVSAADVADAVRWAHPRQAATMLAADGTVVTVTVGFRAGDDRAWLQQPLTSAAGATITLADVATVRTAAQADEVLHVDRQRAITVWAQGRPGTSSSTVRAALAKALPGATLAAADLRALEAEPWSSP